MVCLTLTERGTVSVDLHQNQVKILLQTSPGMIPCVNITFGSIHCGLSPHPNYSYIIIL